MRALLFLNGTPPSSECLRNIDYFGALVVCADGAYAYLSEYAVPDVVVGDFDSLSSDCAVSSGVKVLRYPADKDYTDGHLAMDYILKQNITDITVYGAFGLRADHAYANLSLLYQAKSGGALAELKDENQSVRLLDGNITLDGIRGKTVSIEPFFVSAHIIQTKGLKYNLKNKTLDRLHILGISNIAVEDAVEIESEGELLVFVLG